MEDVPMKSGQLRQVQIRQAAFARRFAVRTNLSTHAYLSVKLILRCQSKYTPCEFTLKADEQSVLLRCLCKDRGPRKRINKTHVSVAKRTSKQELDARRVMTASDDPSTHLLLLTSVSCCLIVQLPHHTAMTKPHILAENINHNLF